MAVRTSLGASGSALAGQLLTESLLIATLGAVVGVAGAAAVISWMATGLPDVLSFPRIAGASMDGRVLGFAGTATAGTALLFGLLPAVKASRTAPAETLGSESRGVSRRTHVARDALVVIEVALSVVLLAGAGLFVRSFQALSDVDDGIEGEHVLVGRVNLAGDEYDEDGRKVALFDELMGRLSTTPGVEAVGGVTFLPMDGLGAATSYWVADRPAPPPDERPAADIRNVAGDYFGAMGIELLQGRTFDGRDREDAPQTVVVNRTLARTYWPDESPIGKRVIVNWLDDTPWEIIGVVEDVRVAGPGEAPREAIYMHYAKAAFFPWLHLTVRTTDEPTRVTNLVRRELAALDNTLPLGNVRVMSDIVGRSVAKPRTTSLLMLVFAGFATILAAVGLYGVLAYTVSRRVREIGVRVALGAEPGRVVRMIVSQGSRLVGVGLVLGLGAGLVANRLVSSLLYGVRPTDALSFVGATAVLSVVALLACAVPAARAVRVPPSEALRPD
jgi:putative ABC transport system permease protein